MTTVNGVKPAITNALHHFTNRQNLTLAEILQRNPHLGVAYQLEKTGSKTVPARPRVLILSDIDGTWVGKDLEALKGLNKEIKRICWDYTNVGVRTFWGYITARPPSRTVKSGAIMPPNMTICYNGGKIFRGSPSMLKGLDLEEWRRLNNQSGFNSDTIFSMAKELIQKPEHKNLSIQTVGEVVGNLEADACCHVATLCIKNESIKLGADETSEIFTAEKFKIPNQVSSFLSELENQIKLQNIQYKITPPYLFSGKPYVMFDIAAPHANKGEAVNFMIKDYDSRNVIIIGDGGNDISMMDDDGRNIVIVGKDHILREKVQNLKQDSIIVRPPDEPCSQGVLEGIKQHLANICQRLKRDGVLEDTFQNPNNSYYPWERPQEVITEQYY